MCVEPVLLLQELHVADHHLVVNACQTGDDLVKYVQLRVGFAAVLLQNFQHVSVQVKSVLQIGNFVLELEVLGSDAFELDIPRHCCQKV